MHSGPSVSCPKCGTSFTVMEPHETEPTTLICINCQAPLSFTAEVVFALKEIKDE